MARFEKGIRRGLAAAMACTFVFLSSCSTLINPYVRADSKTGLVGIGRKGYWEKTPQVSKSSMNLTKAMAYGGALRDKYFDAISEQTVLENMLALGLIPLTAATGYIGITSNSRQSKDFILGALLGGAAALGVGNFLVSKPRQLVYAAGAEAIGCAIDAMEPLNVGDSLIKNFGDSRTTLRNAINELKGVIKITKSNDNSKDTSIKAALIKANETLKAAEIIFKESGKTDHSLNTAGRRLFNAIERIRTRVNTAIISTTSDLSILRSKLGGLVPVAGRIPELPGVPTIAVPKPEGGPGIVNGLLQKLASAMEKAKTKSKKVQELAQQIATKVGDGPSRETIEACYSQIQQAALNFAVIPEEISFANGKETVSKFLITGGKPGFAATFAGKQPPKDTFEMKTVYGPTGAATIDVTFNTNFPEGTYQIIVNDSASLTPAKTITVTVTKGAGNTGGGGGECTTPEGKYFVVKTGSDIKNDISKWKKEKIKKLQDDLGVDRDGCFGPKTLAKLNNKWNTLCVNMKLTGPIYHIPEACLEKETGN